MKNLLKIFVIAIIGFAFSASLFGQATATANATASIVAPIAITFNRDMNFGNIAVGTGGTVQIDPDGTRTASGPVLQSGGSPNSARFLVTGTVGNQFTVTLPAGSVTLGNGGGATMSVSTWTTDHVPATNLIVVAPGAPIQIGATLTVDPAQAAGNYSSLVASGGSGPFTIEVNYQ
jgi:hypothetical protein